MYSSDHINGTGRDRKSRPGHVLITDTIITALIRYAHHINKPSHERQILTQVKMSDNLTHKVTYKPLNANGDTNPADNIDGQIPERKIPKRASTVLWNWGCSLHGKKS